MYHYRCCTGYRKIDSQRFVGDGAIVYALVTYKKEVWMYGRNNVWLYKESV